MQSGEMQARAGEHPPVQRNRPARETCDTMRLDCGSNAESWSLVVKPMNDGLTLN